MYYLQSRYYDPQLARFVNADEVEMARVDKKILALNLYAYCENDPINNIDVAGFASLGSVLADLFKTIVNAAGQLASELLNAYGMNKRTYANKKRYNTATKLMTFVNENKRKLQKTSSVCTNIGNVIEVICIVGECFNVIKGNNFQNNFRKVAELLFYAIRIAVSKLVSKFVSWIIGFFTAVAWWLRYLFELALGMIFDWLLALAADALKPRFINLLERSKVSVDSALRALFKSVQAACC